MKNETKVILEDVKIEPNKDNVDIESDIKQLDGKIQISVNTTLKVDLDEHVYASALFSNKLDGAYTPLLRLEPIPICKYLNAEEKSPILKLALLALKYFGEIPDKCPIAKGHYYVKDIEIDEGIMISKMLSGSYHAEILVQTKEGNELKLICKTTVALTVDQPTE